MRHERKSSCCRTTVQPAISGYRGINQASNLQDAQEHAALAAGDRGRALFLSGQFHLEIARIAKQQTVADMINVLIARSSLIIALYWRRESALCESQAHHALIKAIAENDGMFAEELMQSHLVDLHSALNLHELPPIEKNLRDMLLGDTKR